MNFSSIAMLVFAAFSAATGQLLFRVGAQGRQNWIEFLNSHIFLGLFCYGVGTVIWIYALSFQQLLNVYAFTALTFVLVYLGGVILLGERISMGASMGVVLVMVGLYLITQQNL